MAIIRITKEDIAEAEAARAAALHKDAGFREYEARRQGQRDAAVREMERRLAAAPAAANEDQRPASSRRPCSEDARPETRNITREEDRQP